MKYLLALLLLVAGTAEATRCCNYTENNYYPTETIISPTTEKYSQAIAGAMAAGSHSLDYSTTDWQISLVGAWQVGGGHEDGFSVGVGKRFSGIDALFTGSYTPIGGDDWVTFGGTWRW